MKPVPKLRSVLALALALGSAPLAVAAPSGADPIKVADLRPFALDLPAATLAKSRAPAPIAIRTPDASFIKVHFDYVNLPAGVTLEVANPEGTEVHRYSKGQRDGYTVSPELGQDGKTSFAAM
jgi:lysyl endopeptidase